MRNSKTRKNKGLKLQANKDSILILSELEKHSAEITAAITGELGNCFARKQFPIVVNGFERRPTQEIFAEILQNPSKLITLQSLTLYLHCELISAYVYSLLIGMSKPVEQMHMRYGAKIMREYGHSRAGIYVHREKFIKDIQDSFPPERFLEILKDNPHYKNKATAAHRHLQVVQMLSEEFLASVPDNYAMLYPEARAMKRHFVIHIGPTNSGKTHDAIEELIQAETGIYLAPLRLLAYEQYEYMKERGVRCSMITGEEQIVNEQATHQSSTIEMLRIDDAYEMAVIDEAQMAADPDRGGAWTAAILGIQAKTIHICCSENILACLLLMIHSCGDTYSIVQHERKTPLIMEDRPFSYPKDVHDGDALIVFSRKDVHACAADLSDRKIKCSIIYGNLPYDVRHAEAEKFASGQTQVVVSTDAIGMGMNLPIRRIIFLRTEKFDGHDSRAINASEVKQISGRAGRFGIYEEGYVNSYTNRNMVKNMLHANENQIDKAVIDIPPIFFEKDGKISEILDAWDSLPATRDYEKSNIKEKIELAKELEEVSSNKDLILEFISIPIDRTIAVHELWFDLFVCVNEGNKADIQALFKRYDPGVYGNSVRDIENLESLYKIYDLLYAYATRYESKKELETIVATKRMISGKLNAIFAKQWFQRKTCRICGKKLFWLSQYGICDKCFEERIWM